jgi:O-antigen/teichoic acid export membrane protein
MSKKLFTSLASNGMSVISRLAAGVLIFIGLGRFLSPVEFGLFSYWVGVATILAVIGDFGCSTRVLRDLAVANENPALQYARLARLRFTVSLILFVLSVVIVGALYRTEAVVALLLIMTMLVASAGEYCSNTLRSLGKFQQESRITSLNNFMTAAGVISMALLGVWQATLMYLCLRLFGLWRLNRAVVANGLTWRLGVARWVDVRSSFSFAVDGFVTILSSGFDVLIVRLVGGLTAVASYQAISKLVTGFFVFAQVFSGVFIPRIVRSLNKLREIYFLLAVFLLFSVAFAILLNLSAGLIATDLYRDKFIGIEGLIVSFSFYLIVRFSASAFGIFLTAVGRQHVRVIGNVLSLSATIPLTFFVGKQFGTEAIPYCLALGSALLLAIYAYSTARYFRENKAPFA